MLLAAAFERLRFVGIDTHAASLEAARAHAEEAGVAGRVELERADAASYAGAGYDLICFFDCLHDLGDPVGPARPAWRRWFREAGFRSVRVAHETPFDIVLEVRR